MPSPSWTWRLATHAYDLDEQGHDPSTWKDAVRAASTGSGTLATAYEDGDTLDGITLATGDRILLKDQSTGAQNGIYTVNASGAPTRATDMDTAADVLGALTYVVAGTANAGKLFRNTNTTLPTLETTSLTFSQVGGGGAIAVEEVDGSPTDSAVTKIVFPNGTLGISSHVATYTPSGGGGGGNYTYLAEFVLVSDTADFDFTGISGSYRALEVIFYGRSAKSGASFETIQVQFNGDTGSNYDYSLVDSGSLTNNGATQTSGFVGDVAAATATSGFAGAAKITIPFYADTSFHKVYLTAGYMNYSGRYSSSGGGLWRNTAAITRVRLFPAANNWLAGSRCALYGIT